MKKFEVGCIYRPLDSSFEPIKVIHRTEKTIVVVNAYHFLWRMRIRTDEDGNEYVIDSSVPYKWRGVFTYEAVNEDRS